MKEKEKDIFEKTIKFNTGIKLYMFQTGSIKTKLKFIKMNQGEEPYEIPFPCNGTWDRKAWWWLEQNIDKLEGSILFWNIGGNI